MTSEPLVTCIVAAYDHERFVERALESALAVDWPQDRLRIVVVDDGSTDRTPELIARYADRVASIRKENGGLISSYNRALAEVEGEYVGFLAGDDMWPRDKLRRQVAVLESRPEVGLVYGDLRVIDEDDRVLHESFNAALHVQPRRGAGLAGPLLARNFVSGGSMLVRASLLDRFWPIPAEASAEDWWIALRVAGVAELGYVPEPMSLYRRHGANVSLGAEADRARLARALRAEVRFRRLLLAGEAAERASAAELGEAWSALAKAAADAARTNGVPLADVLPVREAPADTPVRALARDPFDERARAALAAAAPESSVSIVVSSERTEHAIRASTAHLYELVDDPADASCAFVALVDADVRPEPGWLENLVHTLRTEDAIGVAGPRVVRPDGTVEQAGLDPGGVPRLAGVPRDDPLVRAPQLVAGVGGVLLLRRDVLARLGTTDPAQLCARAWADGLRVAYCPASVVVRAARPPALTDARSLTTLAYADEVAAAPGLLAAYADAFGADDDATLVLHAPGLGEAELRALLAPAGLARDDAADVLAVTHGDAGALVDAVDAALTRRETAARRVDERSVHELARRSRRRAAAPIGVT